MFKKIKDFISNHKTACLGILLGFLCLVAIFLPKYLQKRSFTVDYNADNITYNFEDTPNEDDIVDTPTIISHFDYSSMTVSSELDAIKDTENISEFLNLYASDILNNYNSDKFTSIDFVSTEFKDTNNLGLVVDYILNYTDGNYTQTDSGFTLSNNYGNTLDLIFTVDINNKAITAIDYNANFDISLSSLSKLRAISLGSCYSDFTDILPTQDLLNVYEDPKDDIKYIKNGENFIITTNELLGKCLNEEISYEDLISASSSLGLSYSSIVGSSDTTTDEVVSENVSSEEVEN